MAGFVDCFETNIRKQLTRKNPGLYVAEWHWTPTQR